MVFKCLLSCLRRGLDGVGGWEGVGDGSLTNCHFLLKKRKNQLKT